MSATIYIHPRANALISALVLRFIFLGYGVSATRRGYMRLYLLPTPPEQKGIQIGEFPCPLP